MNLTKNFTFEEMIFSSTAIKNGIKNIPQLTQENNLKLLCERVLQPVRDAYGYPIQVTSGFRCKELNRLLGGSPNSQHLRGEAADIICKDNKALWNLIKRMIDKGEIKVGQLINERNLSWIHISLPTDRRLNEVFCLH